MKTGLKSKQPAGRRTEDDHGGRGAASLSHDVAGQTGVVARVGQPCLADDEVVVGAGVDVAVGVGAQQLFVFQPLHLRERGQRRDKRVSS